MPSERKLYSFYITTPLLKGLKAIKRAEGITESEQIRRAIEKWLESKAKTKGRKRAATRKRR